MRHDPVAEVAPGDHRQPGERAVAHRDVDELALARAPALVQRRHHPEGGHHPAAAEVGDLARRLHRRPAGGAGQAEQADQAEVVGVVPGALGHRAVLAVAGDRAEDDPRVGLAHALVADAEAVEDAGAEAVEDDVVVGDQPQQGLAARPRTSGRAGSSACRGSAPGRAPSGCRAPAAPRSRSRAAPSGRSPRRRCPRPSAPRRRGRRAAASRSRPGSSRVRSRTRTSRERQVRHRRLASARLAIAPSRLRRMTPLPNRTASQ